MLQELWMHVNPLDHSQTKSTLVIWISQVNGGHETSELGLSKIVKEVEMEMELGLNQMMEPIYKMPSNI